ncbi:MAG: ABC transporter ATP-binding protein [Prevotellaceae bacterium]|jgi:ABC-type lipoprotein export system ATPase subunit|nr:ABC transporter ATP-binding protein [Prevotellaceae bacterium]
MTLIKLKDIQKSYPDGENRLNRVLQGVDMEVRKGEFIAIKGASGSGKTTLLSILGTLLMPDSGSYFLNNTDMTAPGIDCPLVRNKQIGFVFQDHRLLPQYTAMENILLPALAHKSKAGEEEIDYARRLMELARIRGVANQYPHTLSGGEASRVAVCRALIMKPLLVLADEPTGQLDRENAKNIASLLSEINKDIQTTIVMATHSDETSSVAHCILTLKEGKLQ